MQDDPALYINENTPGYAEARVYPSGTPFGVIFDPSYDEESDRDTITCAESAVADVRARETVLLINDTQYAVMKRPYLDGMGLATVELQER